MDKDLILGVGPVPCHIMFLGEAPGAEEEKTGRPFVGKSGDLLEEVFAVTGIHRRKVFITNAYKKRPPGNRTPTEKELSSHSMILHKELGSVKPKVVVTLGQVASNCFLYQNEGITKLRGKVFSVDGIKIMPTFHPAYILRQKSLKEVWFEDIGAAIEKAFGKQPKGE